eukprot:4701839-Amphidinium_carterae.1
MFDCKYTERKGNPLERLVKYYGDHIALSMTKGYYDSPLSIYNIKNNTNNLATTSTKRPPIETNEYLTTEEHSKRRTIVRKLLWMCSLRPDMQYASKELTKTLQKPDQHDQSNAKRLIAEIPTRNQKLQTSSTIGIVIDQDQTS